MEFAQAIWFIFRVAALVGACAATVTFVVASVCRWMEWAPVNTVVHIHYHKDADPQHTEQADG